MNDCKNNSNEYNEAVCVNVEKIYDSASEKDCLEDLLVTLDSGSTIPSTTTIVKTVCVEVGSVCMNVSTVPFNKGFYSVDITYTFNLTFNCYDTSCGPVTRTITGTATFCKKVILYGSEGNVKTFVNGSTTPIGDGEICSCSCSYTQLPTATLKVSDPISLDTKLVSRNHCKCHCDNDAESRPTPTPIILVSIGIFSIVQLTRQVSILIPSYDYCVPNKEGITNTDTPCEIFDKIDFPVNEFFPPSIGQSNSCN